MVTDTPLLLDTDIGSDIDDALALAYLLRQPRCELVGITTVTGQPERRAALAEALCRAAGRTAIPIHPGCDRSLLSGSRQPDVPQAAGPAPGFSRRNSAVDFMRQAIRRRPGEITLLAIGPLTNIALLFSLDPEIPTLLRRLVLMGGHYFHRVNPWPDDDRHRPIEWNMFCDAHAAAIVFEAPVPLTAIGLDVTLPCRLPAAACLEHLESCALAPLLEMARVWFRDKSYITFHDPLAALMVFDQQVCTTIDCNVEIVIADRARWGLTIAHDSRGGRHRVAAEVDVNGFFSRYFDTLAAV